MTDQSKIEIEEVAAVAKPPRASVEDAVEAEIDSWTSPRETFERKRDYLEGFLAQKPPVAHAGEPGGDLYEGVVEALKEIYDPEIPVNIYDLGLIYAVEIEDDGKVKVEMTLTTPSCPSAQELPGMVEESIRLVPGVTDVAVEVVWDPPWDQSRMSEDAKLAMNLY